MFSIFVSVSFALTLSTDDLAYTGNSVEYVVSGANAGEMVYVAAGQLGTTCHARIAPMCVGLSSPKVVYSFLSDGNDHAFVLQIPAFASDGWIQAVSSFGTSELLPYHVRTLDPLLLTGILVDCAVPDESSLTIEFIWWTSDTIAIATSYLGDEISESYSMEIPEEGPGTLFFWGLWSGADSMCLSRTWVFEIINSEHHECVVQGPDEVALVESGLIYHSCRAW